MSPLPLLLLLSLLSSAFISSQRCPPHELKALLRFRSSVNDTLGMLQSWKGEECCAWDGVSCHETQDGRHVFKLDMRKFWLRSVIGEIGSSLSELKHLSYLNLHGNYFHGEIPSQLGQLSSLHYLHLDSGLTSSNLHWLSNFSSLEYLRFSYVRVSDKSWGSIIGSLLHLKHLDLFGCFTSARTIPSSFLNLSSLTSLDLRSNMFSNIPTWMGQLASLTHLGLRRNNISESVLNAIGNLTNLQYLDLSGNALTGQIRLCLVHNCRQFRSLTHLDLGWNNLEGTIPLSLGLLINITYLRLNNNKLSGNIPSSLGNLHNLTNLLLSDIKLSGNIPSTLGNLHKLIYLDLGSNQLSGSLPISFVHLSLLKTLNASGNRLNGTITEVFFQKFLKLEELDLSNSRLSINISSKWIPTLQLEYLSLKKCQIGGPIPSWMSTQFNLYHLDLSATQLMGNLPSWLWDIDYIDLSDNNLQGSFTPSGTLSYLDLSRNGLSGHLPADIHMHLSNAEMLILANNKFEGKIPASVANLTYLISLDMSINCLTGNVPPTLGKLAHLRALNLQNNYLDGEIPKDLGSLSSLQSLRIGKNGLHGVLPSSLTNCSGLQVLDVGGNNLTGNIPHWIANFSSLHVLVMRSNNFRGKLLPEIGGMLNLQVLDLSSNLFSDTIPSSYFRLPAMENSSLDGEHLQIASDSDFSYSESIDLIIKGQELHYQYILSSLKSFDLSNNRLSGPLPPEIENLKGLMYLNLSMNNLSGLIPESLGNLVQLESVDLCFNNFSGQIPGQLGSLTYLAHLNLSYNNLSGRIPWPGAQLATFDESSYRGNPNLWGCPLQRNCSLPVAGASPPADVGVEEEREEGFEFPWFWMCFGLAVGVGFAGVVMLLEFIIPWKNKYFAAMDRMIEAIDRAIFM